MLTLSTLWILLVSNRYIYNIFILMLLTVVLQNTLSLQVLSNTRLLFNSYISYDMITVSIIIIGSLVALWLISLTIPSPIFYNTITPVIINTNKKTKNSSPTLLDSFSEIREPTLIKFSKKDQIWKGNKSEEASNEFLTLIFLLIIAMGSLAATNSYLTLFVAIELQSLTLYILLATNLSKSNLNSKIIDLIPNKLSKVSLSYLINAATATALLLLGFTIQNNLLILIAILWKLGVMPLHAWSLPILDNQHSLVVSIYLTITKYGTLFVIGLIASQSIITVSILTYIGLLNLTVGNVLGLLQYRYQRIIVFSSLIQIGYMLLILGNFSSLGLGYFELYSFFTILLLMLWIVPTYNKFNANNLLPSVQLWTLVLTLYTVAGLPFFPLFWTKLDVLLAIQSESLTIALISTLLSSLIYVRLIKYVSHLKTRF